MGVARRTGLPGFIGGGNTVHAAKITAMATDNDTGYTHILFGEIGKKIVAIPQWVNEHQPQIGGYFVVTEKGQRSIGRFMSADDFINKFRAE